MKAINLKIVDVVINGESKKLSYKGQLIELMRQPAGDRGADIDEIRRSIRVLDSLDASDGVLELEDADFEFMKNKILHARWPVVDRYVLSFVDDVTK